VYEFPPLITVCKVLYCRTVLIAWVVGVHNNSNISFWPLQFAKLVVKFETKS